MSKRDDLIAAHAEDLRVKCGTQPDMALLTKVTIGCGPSIHNADSATPMDGIKAAIETYAKSERQKHRAVDYYLLVKHFGKEASHA